MKAAGITLSTVGAGGGSNPFLEQLAKNGGGRFYAAANVASIPDIFLKETQQVAGQQIIEESFFPIQTELVADPARPRGGPPEAPRLQRHDDQVGRAARARLAARRSRSSPSGSTASAGPSPGPPTRPGAGPRTGSAGPGFSRFFSQLVGWTFPGEETGGIEASFETVGGQTRLHVESVEATARRATSTTRWPRSRARTSTPREVLLDQVAPGVYEAEPRRDRLGRVRRPDHPDAARSAGARADGRARRAGRGRVPAARRERGVPGLAARRDGRPRDRAADGPVAPRPRAHLVVHRAVAVAARSWRCCSGRSTSPCGASRSGGASSSTRAAGSAGAGGSRRAAAPRTAAAEGMLAARERAAGGAARAALLRRPG